ncbi:terminal uridylyltransferase 4-like [Daphnia carinata]|uniref:terminal uridylyltransferase 4-like n=1 Tax=Daphnia carinata TaxID=120202 RepID=UPI00257F7E14|nr:terminal uridylyltransferase 4-like [Daphnia carinata]
MAESTSVALLEQDLKKYLGITPSANIPTSSQSAQNAPYQRNQKIISQPEKLDTLATKTAKVSRGRNSESTPDKRPQKPLANQRKEVSHRETSSSTKPVAKSVKGENASAKLKDDCAQEKKNNVAQKHPSIQQIPNESTSIAGFIRDRRWHADDQTTKKNAKAFSRNGEEIPENWRQPPKKISQVPRKGTPKGSNSSAEEPNSSKHASISELAMANNVSALSEGTTKSGMKGDQRQKRVVAKAKSIEKLRAKKEGLKTERNELTSRLILEYKEVPKHLSESNYPAGIVPSCPPIGPATQSNGKKNGARPVSKDAENHRDELPQMTNQDGEEIVRIVVLPTPPQQTRKKGTKHEKQEAPGKAEDDGSSSSSSSSSEEEKTPRPSAVQQPLIFNIRRPELELFRRKGVLPLKHISPKFPRAIFHCRLCSFHISSIPEVYRHMKDDRHVRLQNQERSRQTASLMPFPTPEIADVIGQFVENIYQCSGLTAEDLKIRRTATEILKNMIETAFPGFTIRPYGSVVTELGLRASDVNVGLIEISPDSKKDGLIIIQVLSWLRGPASNSFRHIGDDLNCRTPVIHFQYEQMGITFAMVVESENAYKTTLLLQQYRIIDPRFAVLTVAFRTFARICSLDQPELGSLPPHAFTLMVLYYLQQDRVLPVLHQLKKGDSEDDYMSAAEFLKMKERGEWESKDLSLAHLWLGLLKFYAYTFSHNEHAVCVRSLEPLLRSTKNWGNRRIAIEDPFHGNVNMGSFMSTSQAFDFFLDCMRNLFHYFWIPHTANGPLFVHLLLPGEVNIDDPLQCTRAEAVRRMTALKKEDVKWDFQPEKILLSKRLPVICTICSADGHTKQKCTELEVPDVGFIPPPDFNYFALLDNVCWNIFRNFAQREVDTTNRKTIQKELETHIRGDYPDAVLSMFGSSCNGFGFADSDVDLCLTFESNKDGKGIDFVAVVKKLAKSLRRNRFFCDIVPISSAKVPIVKLRHRPTGLESDISLYNQLGKRNSQLLATYCAIDTRVRILGYMAKLLAKQCEIGDASRGSLSSYAYTLMVIHYLQQVTPPVIPVLQEIKFEGSDREKYMVEGWDTWFFENTEDLGRVWPHHGANREPPSTLWLGFLLYYAKLFDYRLQVVSIRQLKPLFRLEKMWTDRPIAIEDPFDLSHNLGSGVSLRMGAYIRRVFVTARRFFQTPVRALPPHFSSLEEYLFNPKVLISTGPPPNDRGCLICGKVGHKAKECENRGKRNRGQDQNPPQPRDNPQNTAQEVHNRNMPQQTMNRDRGPQQMNRYRPQGFHQMNRDRGGGPLQYQQVNRHRPVRPNHRPGMPQNSGEQIFPARRPTADPNQP